MVPFPADPSNKIIFKECFFMIYPAISVLPPRRRHLRNRRVPAHDNYAQLKSQMIQLLDLLRSILYPMCSTPWRKPTPKQNWSGRPASASGDPGANLSGTPSIGRCDRHSVVQTPRQPGYAGHRRAGCLRGRSAATCRRKSCWPTSLEAISIFRIAHELYLMKVPCCPG